MNPDTFTMQTVVYVECQMEMTLLEDSHFLCPLYGNESPVQVQKLTDSTINAHCFNCGGNRHKRGMQLNSAQGKFCRNDNRLINEKSCELPKPTQRSSEIL